MCEQDQFEKDRQEYEKAWSRLLALYGKALA